MIYEQGSEAQITATFVNYKGEAASISGTPTVTIYHIKNDSAVTDVNAQNMTQISGSTYRYKFYISTNADKSDYIAVFSASYTNGETVVGESSFKVVESKFYERARGGSTVNKYYGVWDVKEKKKLLKSLDTLKETLDKLQTSNSDLSAYVVELRRSILDSISMKLDSASNNTNNLKRTLSEANEKLSDINKEIDNLSSSKEVDNVKNDIREIAKLIVKTLPEDEVEL